MVKLHCFYTLTMKRNHDGHRFHIHFFIGVIPTHNSPSSHFTLFILLRWFLFCLGTLNGFYSTHVSMSFHSCRFVGVSNFPGFCFFKPKWATKKDLPTFHYTGCLIGILIVIYYNPHITGWYNSLYTRPSWWLNQPIWKICSSNWIISPGIGVKIPKMFELPPPR